MDERMRIRAVEPRYTFPEAAILLDRHAQTLRRWSLGNSRGPKRGAVVDAPLIQIDGTTGRDGVPLSFLNLLELRMLSQYRDEAPLPAIRGALDYASRETGVERPLLTVQFRLIGGELFRKFATTDEGELLVNASRGGQVAFAKIVAEVTKDIEYQGDVAHRWYPRGHESLVLVDTKVAGGRPITAVTGTRADAIASRIREGMDATEIKRDTGATVEEIAAVGELENLTVAA